MVNGTIYSLKVLQKLTSMLLNNSEISMDVYMYVLNMTALLEYIDHLCKRAYVTPAHPSLNNKSNCAVLLLLAAHCSQIK